MRCKDIIAAVLFVLVFASLPAASLALTFQFGGTQIVSTSPPVDISGTRTTTLPVNGVTSLNGNFRIDGANARVIAEQTATTVRITFRDATVKAIAPGSLVIHFFSSGSDFTGTPSGSYSYGVSASGFYTGILANETSIAATAIANGDTINRTPTPDPTTNGPSLPVSCAGTGLGCRFIVDSVNNIFSPPEFLLVKDNISLFCDGPSCVPTMDATINLLFANAEDTVDFPVTIAGTRRRSDNGDCNTACQRQLLNGALGGGFGPFSAAAEIKRNKFELLSLFVLDAGSPAIDPPHQFVSFRLGPFSATIPAGSFTEQMRHGRRFFRFEGTVRGARLEAIIVPLGGNAFEFDVEAHGVNMRGTPNPAPVRLTFPNVGGTTVAIRLEHEHDD